MDSVETSVLASVDVQMKSCVSDTDPQSADIRVGNLGPAPRGTCYRHTCACHMDYLSITR
jgi:hypothetical protein